jgi:hypothetical protein
MVSSFSVSSWVVGYLLKSAIVDIHSKQLCLPLARMIQTCTDGACRPVGNTLTWTRFVASSPEKPGYTHSSHALSLYLSYSLQILSIATVVHSLLPKTFDDEIDDASIGSSYRSTCRLLVLFFVASDQGHVIASDGVS